MIIHQNNSFHRKFKEFTGRFPEGEAPYTTDNLFCPAGCVLLIGDIFIYYEFKMAAGWREIKHLNIIFCWLCRCLFKENIVWNVIQYLAWLIFFKYLNTTRVSYFPEPVTTYWELFWTGKKGGKRIRRGRERMGSKKMSKYLDTITKHS